jgi:hypothetical protein
MRFSNIGEEWTRSDWEDYKTFKSWTLSEGEDDKTVYAQFDTDGDNDTIEAITSDSISFPEVVAEVEYQLRERLKNHATSFIKRHSN